MTNSVIHSQRGEGKGEEAQGVAIPGAGGFVHKHPCLQSSSDGRKLASMTAVPEAVAACTFCVA
ncbi:protein of unknown function [Pseudomonas sp. JV241A]|nr:protein of unknown function [Pseudomonas sp. JV241A]